MYSFLKQGVYMMTDQIEQALYQKLFLIQESERIIQECYPDNDMKTPMHMSVGQEGISVGVCQALMQGDVVVSSYRSHAVYLAQTGDTDGFFAEMYGKKTGSNGGKAGSMHLSHPEKGYLGASAVVASQIPLAVGACYALKVKKKNNIAIAFFGDGAIDEGVFWESLNLASLWKLPILFVCEDNGYAVHTPSKQRHGYESFSQIVRQYNCIVSEYAVTDIFAFYKEIVRIRMEILSQKMPALVYVPCRRHFEHVGVNNDDQEEYRREKDSSLETTDGVGYLRNIIKQRIGETDLLALESGIRHTVAESLQKAKVAPFPSIEELMKGVYA